MPCIVCGNEPTVKSHILPRALFHMMKRPGKTFVTGRNDGPGYRIIQSGHWDGRLLCDVCEARLGVADRYGVAFCREFMELARANNNEVEIPNPKPSLLVEFAMAVVWRMAASRTYGRPATWLGPYSQKFTDRLFKGGDFDPLLLISRHAYRLREDADQNFGALPFKYAEEGLRFWRFICCGLVFDIKLDNRAALPHMAFLAVNDRKSICIHPELPTPILTVPGIAEAYVRAAARPRPKKI